MSSSPPNAGPVLSSGLSRVYYLDWLRVLTTLCVFLFHSARFFDIFNDWHVRNSTTWLGGTIIVGFMSQWIMPIFFVLAGASTYYSLRSRTGAEFARERVLRLLVPWAFGMLIVVVPQAYYEAVFHGKLSGVNIMEAYPLYIATLPGRIIDWDFYHLWFLAFLFIFSMVCLPLFLVKSKSGNTAIDWLASKIDAPWKLVLLLVVPLAAASALIYPVELWGSKGFGGWNMITYMLLYLSGYLLFSNERINGLLRRLGWFAPVCAVAVYVAMFFMLDPLMDWKTHYGSMLYIISLSLQALGSWCLMIIFFNLGRQYLNFKNRFLSYASDAVLPFYILHQTVIICVGFYVVQLDLDPALKYLIIVACSFISIMGIYDLLVRRINVLRFLFGMRLKKKVNAPA